MVPATPATAPAKTFSIIDVEQWVSVIMNRLPWIGFAIVCCLQFWNSNMNKVKCTHSVHSQKSKEALMERDVIALPYLRERLNGVQPSFI